MGLFGPDIDYTAIATAQAQAQAQIASARASADAAKAQSAAQVQMSMAQDATMRLGILKSSQDAQFQTLAWLTDRLDSNDTKMQIAVENAKLAFQQESDRHVEAIKGLENDARQQEIDAADRQSAAATSTSSFIA
jgi:hypothetical protein